VALTGGIATGKSYVRAALAAAGVPTLDADTLAREAVTPGSDALAAVVAAFGASVLGADGALDRGSLARRVFSDPDARRRLEAIIHPRVREATAAWFADLQRRGDVAVAVVDIPLLFEVGRDRDFDRVVVVACEPQVQLARVMARDHLDEAAAHARLAAQWPLDRKIARADHVVRTDGTFADTDREVARVLPVLAAWGASD
jgi:dephospho-CoA kinase